jgi:hypothetical protein
VLRAVRARDKRVLTGGIWGSNRDAKFMPVMIIDLVNEAMRGSSVWQERWRAFFNWRFMQLIQLSLQIHVEVFVTGPGICFKRCMLFLTCA